LTVNGYPTASAPGQWVLLCYRLPREPSTPRIAVWRKLKRLGAAQLGDGLVALPADARTREHLDWIADEVTESGGTASVWLAQPASRRQEHDLAQQMATARAAEYAAITKQATAGGDGPASAALLRRLRAEFGRVTRRDFFPPPERTTARTALDDLAAATNASVST
jgi:hypothetical protein